MKTVSVEMLSNSPNAVVVRVPGRQFPGIVIQGDSLKILLDSAREVARLSRDAALTDLSDSAEELERLLSGYLSTYEASLNEHGIPLPYSK